MRKAQYNLMVLIIGLLLIGLATGCRRGLSPEEFAKKLQVKYVLSGHNAQVLAVAFSKDGKTLVSTDFQGKTFFWDAESGKQKKESSFMGLILYSLSLSPDGKYLAAGGRDQAVILYDGEKMDGTATSFIAHSQWLTGLNFGPENLLATASCLDQDPRAVCLSSEVALWRIGEKNEEIKRFSVDKGMVRAIAISPNGEFVVVGGDSELINLYKVGSGELVRSLSGHTETVNYLSFAGKDSSLLISASQDGTIRYWRMPSGEQVKMINAHPGGVFAMAVSSDGKIIASGGADKVVRLWLRRKGEQLREFAGLEGNVSALDFSPDGKKIAVGLSDNNILILTISEQR